MRVKFRHAYQSRATGDAGRLDLKVGHQTVRLPPHGTARAPLLSS